MPPTATPQPSPSAAVSPTPTPDSYPELTPSPAPTTGSYPVGDGGADTARRLAQAVLPPRDLVEISSRLLFGGEPLARTVPPDTRPFEVGRQDRFWITDPSLDRQYEITATLYVITPHLYMYVQNGREVDQEALLEAAQTFEEKIYPTVRQAFGSEWNPGVDGDPHLTILHASFDDASGYFSSLNQVPRQVNPYSNQREMFHMSLNVRIGSSFYLSTLAHEFQHLIHWSVDPRSDSWVEEGMSQMAEQICGYDPSDLAWAFLSEPDLQLTTWTDDPEEALGHYAASYLWFRYLTYRAGGSTALRSILDPEVDGITAIERVLEDAAYQPTLEAPRLFDAFFADWVVANYVNNAAVEDGRYAYDPDLEPYPIWSTEWVYAVPWETTATVSPYGTDYIEIVTFDRGTLHISFDGAESLPLVDTSPHSGTHFWWSNRGDQGDSSLTRAFDLRGTAQATLRYWLWYDIEADYDYAYVEVSTDGGRSWSILRGQETTDSNPNGNSFGHGYTGVSGGGSDPLWIQEQIDLTPFAGREILLRFEMITDDAYHAPGLVLDDVEIPEIGFFDDMETDEGWEGLGFVWVDNTVPLHFLVQAVVEGHDGDIRVESLRLDAARQGTLDVPGFGSDVAQVVLIVAAVAPATTEPATYRVSLTME